MRPRKALFIGLAATAIMAIVGFFGYDYYDYYLVETSPVGSYFHYQYIADVSASNATEYTLILPMIVYQNGTPMRALVPDRVYGDANFSEITTSYGPALELHGRGNVTISAVGTYDAIRLSKDHKSDGTPAFSMWDRPSGWPNGPDRKSDNSTIRLWSSPENVTITITFKAWSKWWHVTEGVFHSGYERGGRGYYLQVIGESRPLAPSPGWGNYTVRCGIILIE